MLRRLALRDFVIVQQLDVEPGAGFSVLTGETGAGKSILVDALQLALGSRGDAGVVREGAARAEISAEFDTPEALRPWLNEAGFEAGFENGNTLLLRRTIDAQGKSRAWVNGSAATIGQLREAADRLVEIHGQHAWQSLTQPAAVRALLDHQAGVDPAPMAAAWAQWRAALAALQAARGQRDGVERERERLQWQVGEVDKLAPGAAEWAELNAEHQRLANAQALLDAARTALDALSEGEPASADTLNRRAADALGAVSAFDAELATVFDTLQAVQTQLQDAAHTLRAYLGHNEPDPARLAELDTRLSAWLQLARRYRRPPAELPALLQGWRDELRALDAAADLEALERSAAECETRWRAQAKRVSALRKAAAPAWGAAITQAMQHLGMGGGRFEVALMAQPAQAEAQSFGLESVDFLVAGHTGVSPRPLAKVASGGELSRLALAIAATAARNDGAVPTLIFDEIDAGIGGAVGDTVGRLLQQLGARVQVLAVTHLAQVAACADAHLVVSKALQGKATVSCVKPVAGEARVAEIARMLGGERLSGLAHAQAMLSGSAGD